MLIPFQQLRAAAAATATTAYVAFDRHLENLIVGRTQMGSGRGVERAAASVRQTTRKHLVLLPARRC